jgi:large subunit ribosomal protein L25
MKSVALTAFPRTLVKRLKVKQLRAAGRIPAVIYGGQTPPQNLEVGDKDLDALIHHSVSENILVDLQLDGDARPQRLVLVQEVQHHPLSGKVLHVDFHEVSATERVTIMVPVESTGEAVGVKTGGGVLEHVVFKLKVRALPKDLPEAIYVDVSSLEIGKSVHLGEIPAIPGVEILGDKNAPVLTVAAPITEAEEAAATEAATATAGEPEMIKEKKDEEGAAPAGKGDAKAGDKAAAGKADPKADAKAGDKKPDAKAEKKK